ncbi:uncharacterized protein misp3 [Eucyclogobius newberryi]|uniref:uncharacterized protein misp3 n=1 Tax=Eucyclogobius newberryi TaxID=166745 RepID=UPI003B5B9BCA
MPSPPFADVSDGQKEADFESTFNFKYNASESTGVALPVHVGDDLEQQVALSSQTVLHPVSDIQSRQEYLSDNYNNDEVGERDDTAECLNSETDLTVSSKSIPVNCDYIAHSRLFVKENHQDHLSALQNLNCKTDVSKSTASTSPAVDVFKQQEALSVQRELPPQGVNQEATQQVLSQASPPLSTVSIEPANHAALSEGSAVVIGESRVGHGTEGESRQITENGAYKVCEREPQIRGGSKSNQEQSSEKSRRVSSQDCTMESDSCDESDSGVSADFSPGSTLESGDSSARVPKETPIEREIRRAVEREHSLRRSRGLPNPPTAPQYVEIPLRKAVFSPSLLPTKTERCQGKDKLFAGKKMQQDISEGTRREQDLVKLGKIPGFYDKGTVRQLRERKQLFEAFQTPNESVQSKATSSSNDISTLENDTLSNKVIQNGSDSRNELHFKTPKVVPEAKSCQIVIIENNLDFPSKRPNTNKSIRVVDSSKEKTRKVQEVTDLDLPPKENPFFKLRSSTSVVKVEQDIREAQERERELRKQRINLYGTQVEGEGGRPAAIEEHSRTLSSLKALPVQDLPDPSQNGVTSTIAARHSSGKTGTWPPATTEKTHQTEVQRCPRIPRQKTPLVQRWESGLITASQDD